MSTTTAPTSATSRPITRLSHIDLGLVATLLLCLFTLWPLLQQPGLPNGTDTLYHTYRVAEMDRAWTHGVLMPRWAETFYYGYGSPVFHYYASTTYYVTSVLMRLFALNAVDSLRALTVLSMLLAGGGMYLFLRDATGHKLAGVIAALVYVYSPYIVFTEPYTRGAYPELLALAWFPLVMWRYERLMRAGGGLALVLAALSSDTLIITHNLMALVLTGVLAAWVGWRWLTRTLSLSRFLWTTGAVILGVALAAYFWIPVILEQDAARLGNLTAVAQLDFRNFFVPLPDLLAFSPQPDTGAINGLIHQLNLGVAGWTLAITGIIGIFASVRRSRSNLTPASLRSTPPLQFGEGVGGEVSFMLFFALFALLLIVLMLPAAAFLWDAVSPLAFLQFPWRFLGPAVFCLAVLAGFNALWIKRLPPSIGAALTALLVMLPIALAMPALVVDEWDNTSVDASVAAYHQAELSGLQRATTFSDEYLPAAVVIEPSANADLLADFADGYPVDRANRAGLPAGVTLDLLEHGPQHDVWQVAADQDFTLEVLVFDFPGWQATVDDMPVEVQPSQPHGMVTFDVPAGEHTLRLFMGQTPARWLGIGVSVLALFGLAVAIFSLSRRGSTSPALEVIPMRPAHRLGILIGGGLQLVLLMIFMREGLAWVHSPPGTALLAQNHSVYDLGSQIQLLGHDLNSTTFRPGDRLELTVYWYGREPVDYGYATFVHVSNGGPPLAQADKQNPAGRPTLKWTPEGFIQDMYLIDLPGTMPPGEYQLTVGMYTCDTRPPGECGNGDRLPVTDAQGRALGDAVPLATIEVR